MTFIIDLEAGGCATFAGALPFDAAAASTVAGVFATSATAAIFSAVVFGNIPEIILCVFGCMFEPCCLKTYANLANVSASCTCWALKCDRIEFARDVVDDRPMIVSSGFGLRYIDGVSSDDGDLPSESGNDGCDVGDGGSSALIFLFRLLLFDSLAILFRYCFRS